ncbi:MAG: 23S rRNA (uracil(1939)-C(5))-methyltransferase RlmD [Pseudomonadales bacterium]|jgi:23S rRNA (uracil1939-C5)-methyltransferase|nr:23S rRNA (uracil(1939)-C(5))-methyltransferase RlmD [Pseudomonadales bacterium]
MSRRPSIPLDTLVEIDGLDQDGAGLAAVGARRLRVFGALPGERSTVRVMRRRQGRLETVAETVAQSHVDRVSPPCPYAGRCSGCALQHLAPSAQRRFKRERLAGLLLDAGVPAPERWLADVHGPELGYRRKARLGARLVPGKGGVLLGYRERGSGRIADLDACRTLAPEIGERLIALRALIGSLTVAAAVPQIEIAVGDDATAIIVRHLEPLGDADRARLEEGGRALSLHVYLQPAGPDSVHRIWPLEGAEVLHYRLAAFDLDFRFHPLEFVQVNPFVNAAMVAQAVDLLAPSKNERVLDLFCGLGNFTLPLATRSGKVVGMEGSQALVTRAQENAVANGLDNVRFEATDLYGSACTPARLPAADAVLLDPPRSGAEILCRDMGALGPRRVLYVSCNPETLARDARLLHDGGFRLEAAGILDMFPHTTHVESMALFRAV